MPLQRRLGLLKQPGIAQTAPADHHGVGPGEVQDLHGVLRRKHVAVGHHRMKQQGYIVCAVEQAEGSTMLDKLLLDKDKKYAVVMGNEVKGVQQCVVDNCDMCIEIPQYGTKHSLNVSVTTGIIIWDFFKQLSD